MRRHDRGPPKGGLIRKGIQGLAGGVGLISESVKAHKEGKAAEKERGSTSRTNSDGDTSLRAVSAPDGPPPTYSEDCKAGPSEKPANTEQQEPSIEPENNLEDEWNLDDAQDPIIGDSSKIAPARNIDELEQTFLGSHPPPDYSQQGPTGRLALPVVLPQRRPKNRTRGFIRAYAPVLENCGIDQVTWLDFLDTFQKSTAANPWLNAINMFQFATFALPTPIGLAVGYAISQVTNAAIELQSRQRTSNFLYKINEEFFRPRGLYCLVMTWNPDSAQRIVQVNLADTIASRSNPSTNLGGLAGLPNTFRASDGNKIPEWDFPEVAPLVFPGLDQVAAETSPEDMTTKKKMAEGMKFVGNYWDKRATAQYAMENPNSFLANVPQGEFKSRYSDPKSKAASGSLISFVSGGHLVPNPESRGLIGGLINVAGQAVRGEKQGSGWDRMHTANAQQQGGYYGAPYGSPQANQQWGDQQFFNPYSRHYRGRRNRREGGALGVLNPVTAAKKVLKQNILYLMVVNMPSDEELAQAQALLR